MKKKQSKAQVSTPVEQLTPEDSIAHYNAVMIEEIRSTVRTELEGLHTKVDSLENKMGAFRCEVNARFDTVEAAIKVNAQGIRELQTRMNHVEHKIDRIIDRVDDHEERITSLETA